MTPEALIVEAVLVAIAKGIGVFCIVAFVVIVGKGCYHAWQEALNGIARDL